MRIKETVTSTLVKPDYPSLFKGRFRETTRETRKHFIYGFDVDKLRNEKPS